MLINTMPENDFNFQGSKDIGNNREDFFGRIPRIHSWNTDKVTAYEWISGSPANFSLQRSWPTLLYRFVFF